MQRNILLSNIFFLSILLSSCINNTNEEKVQIVSINTNNVENLKAKKLFSKIELIPLQTIDTCLIGNIRNVIFTDNYFIISDNNDVISLFDKFGKFISNSAKQKGSGPADYSILFNISFNKFLNCIDLTTPRGLISYDTHFRFVKNTVLPSITKKSKTNPGFFIDKVVAIDQDKYVMLPTQVSENPNRIIFYDSKNKRVIKEISYDDDVIAQLTQQVQNFAFLNDSILAFNPPVFSNYHYLINLKTMTLNKYFKFDLGMQNIKKEDLNKFNSEREKCDFLAFKSKNPLPLRTFFNFKYIITHIRKQNKYLTYFKQFGKTETCLINNKSTSGMQLPYFDELINNVLYATIQPKDLEKFVNIEIMSDKDRALIKKVKVDDNPVIVKCYLK